jgi:hypothetical protein
MANAMHFFPLPMSKARQQKQKAEWMEPHVDEIVSNSNQWINGKTA